MFGLRTILLVAAAAILIATGAIWLSHARLAGIPSVPKVIGPAEIAQLQLQATQSCKCARSATDKAGKKACWADFERVRAAHPTDSDAASPCGALSPQWACFAGTDDCVITHYSIYEEAIFCTPEEVREVDAALTRAYHARGTNVVIIKDELEIMKRYARAYANGRAPGAIRSEGGCAG